ncbi:hypothetical protein GE09DRAFT_1127896 [Coniochaeta sp. 2T2.1]|nr:hypothetical protein GE09DRAFT_1127896 [Coniochaeta sp. 2T2.1]
MERPAKRARIGSFLHDDNEADDELFHDPAEINAQRDPAVILEKSRAVATFKLKSRWEDVFKKYEQDFTGEDDIINFYGSEPELEVDNGHLRSLEDADDGKSVAASDTADLEEEERILHGNAAGGGQLARMGPSSLMAHPSFGGRLSALAPGPPKLSAMFSPGFQVPSYSPFGSAFKSFNAPTDSMWNAPELPPEAFNNHAIATTVPKRRVVRQALMAAEEDGSDEEDDILMGNTPSWRQEKETENEKEQPAAPEVAPQEPNAVKETGVPEEAAIERVKRAETISDSQEVVTPPPRRKVSRPKGKPKGPTPTAEAGPPNEIDPEPSPTAPQITETHQTTTPASSLTKHTVSESRKQAWQPARRRSGRLRDSPEEEGSALVTKVAPEDITDKPSNVTGIASDTQEPSKEPERRRPGRPRKHPQADPLPQKVLSTARSGVTIVPDSDAEPLDSSAPVSNDTDQLDKPEIDTSSAEPSIKQSRSVVRIEIQLFRRRPSGFVPVPDTPETPPQADSSVVETSALLDALPVAAQKPTKSRKSRRTLPQAGEPQPDGARRHSLPVAESIELGTQAQSGTTEAPQTARPQTPIECTPATHAPENAMVIEPQNSPRPEVPQQPQPAAEPAAKPAAPAAQFSRNAIDKDYGFSDEDTAWVAPSRVRKTTKQVKKPSSTPNRSLMNRRPKVSTFLGSSPSIRAAFPVVKRSIRTTRTKPQEVISPPQQPELTETPPDEVARDNIPDTAALPTLEIEDFVIEIPDGPDLPTQDVEEISPSPVVPADTSKKQSMPTTPSTDQTKENPAPAATNLATPTSRQSKPKRTSTPSTHQPSTSKRSILSLLSESDEDELSLSLDQISPLAGSVHSNHHAALPIRSRSSTAKKSTAVKRLSLGSYARATPQQQKKSWLSSGWSASAAKAVRRKSDAVEDPDVHRTPGGTMRRCGEDGFKCERDFCFTCL